MKTKQRLNKAEIEEQLDEAWHETLKSCGMESNLAEVKKYLKEQSISPDSQLTRGFTLGMGLGLGNLGKVLARKVKTKEELEKKLAQIREVKEKLPTVIRKVLKDFTRALPRRGGPGARPKLDPREASQMCDQISLFVRQKCSVKEALQRTSEASPSLIGKKVSPRTLQKAWDRRDEFTTQ